MTVTTHTVKPDILIPGRIFATKNGWVRMIIAVDGDTVCYTDDGYNLAGTAILDDREGRAPFPSVCTRATFRSKIDVSAFVDDAARVERARSATREWVLSASRPMLIADGVPESLHAQTCREATHRNRTRRTDGYLYVFDGDGNA